MLKGEKNNNKMKLSNRHWHFIEGRRFGPPFKEYIQLASYLKKGGFKKSLSIDVGVF